MGLGRDHNLIRVTVDTLNVVRLIGQVGLIVKKSCEKKVEPVGRWKRSDC